MASAEMESVEFEMEMPPLDVKILPCISSRASSAFAGLSNTVQEGSTGLGPEMEELILHVTMPLERLLTEFSMTSHRHHKE